MSTPPAEATVRVLTDALRRCYLAISLDRPTHGPLALAMREAGTVLDTIGVRYDTPIHHPKEIQ